MNKAQKHELADALREKLSKAQVAIVADYKGLTAVQADEFRKQVRQTKGEVKTLKNNIARKIVADGAFGDDAKTVMDGLVGPTLIAFGYGDAAATAKVVHTFAKDNEALIIKDGLFGKRRISAKDVEAIASLPSREVLLAQLLGVLNGPARGFVSVLAAVPRGFVTVLQAVADKKKDTAQA